MRHVCFLQQLADRLLRIELSTFLFIKVLFYQSSFPFTFRFRIQTFESQLVTFRDTRSNLAKSIALMQGAAELHYRPRCRYNPPKTKSSNIPKIFNIWIQYEHMIWTCWRYKVTEYRSEYRYLNIDIFVRLADHHSRALMIANSVEDFFSTEEFVRLRWNFSLKNFFSLRFLVGDAVHPS